MADGDTVNCSVCWEHVSDTNIITCNSIHAICGDDVERIFEVWIKNRITHRPQCFQAELTLRDCIRFLSRKTLEAYQDQLRTSAEAGSQAEAAAPDDEEDKQFVKEAAEKGEL